MNDLDIAVEDAAGIVQLLPGLTHKQQQAQLPRLRRLRPDLFIRGGWRIGMWWWGMGVATQVDGWGDPLGRHNERS
jgi:hypothetical protein